MPELERSPSIDNDELELLKILGIKGATKREIKASTTDLTDLVGASNQTVSRRLQSLEKDGFVERDMVADGQWIRIGEDGERVLRNEYEDYRHIFEEKKTVELSGEVVSGMGEGEYYISLEGYMRQFRDKLNYEPFPGTLNIELDGESTRARSALNSVEGIEIEGWENEERTFGGSTCYEAGIGGVKGHVIKPHRSHYPEDMLEVIAPVELREELDLEDSDTVTVEVTLE